MVKYNLLTYFTTNFFGDTEIITLLAKVQAFLKNI